MIGAGAAGDGSGCVSLGPWGGGANKKEADVHLGVLVQMLSTLCYEWDWDAEEEEEEGEAPAERRAAWALAPPRSHECLSAGGMEGRGEGCGGGVWGGDDYFDVLDYLSRLF